MGLHRAWCSGWLRTAVALGLLGLLVPCCAHRTQAQTPARGAKNEPAARDVRSRNFLVHTDLSDRDAKDLVDELEAMLRQISTYWDRPMQGTIECYVIRDFDNFSLAAMDSAGISGIKTAGGVTLMGATAAGKGCRARSVVYASARPEVVRHEAVHAYCHQSFGRVGPIWYSEGMAEMGHYWKDGDAAVRAGQREVRFLRENPPKSLAQTLSLAQVSGDSWQNYPKLEALTTKFSILGLRSNVSPLAVGADPTEGVVVKTYFVDFSQSHAMLKSDDSLRVKDRSCFSDATDGERTASHTHTGHSSNRIARPKGHDSG